MVKPPQSISDGLRSATMVNGGLELVLNNRIAAIEDGRRRMAEFLAGMSLDDAVRNRLEVVFEELVSNTIRHGFKMHSDQSIHVRVDPRPGTVELTFEDDGWPFNPLEAPPSEPPKSIETARIGGLGIPLVARMSASVNYQRLSPASGQPGFAPCNRLVVTIAT